MPVRCVGRGRFGKRPGAKAQGTTTIDDGSVAPKWGKADVAHLLALLADAGGDAHGVHEALGICLDTGHRHLHGDVAEATRQAGRAISTLHIHDNHGTRDEHRLPLDGTIAWAPVLRALREIGHAGVFLYEIGKDADVSRLPANCRTLMTLK